MLCFCLSYNMVSLFGVKHMHRALGLFSGYRRKQSELSHFSPACHRLSPSSKIFTLLRLSNIFEFRLLTFVFDSVNKTSAECFHNFFVFNGRNRLRFVYTHFKSCDQSLDKISFDFSNIFRAMQSCAMCVKSRTILKFPKGMVT